MLSNRNNPSPPPASTPPRRVAGARALRCGRVAFPAAVAVIVLAACSSGGHSGARSSKKHEVAVDPATATFGQAFQLGKLTVVITDAGTLPSPSAGAAPRRRLVVHTENQSGATDKAPGLAVVCEQALRPTGGSLYADPEPKPRPFVAGKPEPPGSTDTASITVAIAPACERPALQVSPGGATINGLPRPVLIAMT